MIFTSKKGPRNNFRTLVQKKSKEGIDALTFQELIASEKLSQSLFQKQRPHNNGVCINWLSKYRRTAFEQYPIVNYDKISGALIIEPKPVYGRVCSGLSLKYSGLLQISSLEQGNDNRSINIDAVIIIRIPTDPQPHTRIFILVSLIRGFTRTWIDGVIQGWI